jgi:hypothetical protein
MYLFTDVFVACTKISESYFKRFADFVESKLRVSIHLSKYAKTAPCMALCIQHDGIQKDIQELCNLTGKNEFSF